VLTIRGAKFGKTRLVPLHASACTVLAEYLRRRQRHWKQRPVSSYVFVSSWGHRLDGADIHRTFYALSRQIGLRDRADRHGPRIHDLRHRFAGKTLWRWYRTGEDPERRLPILSARRSRIKRPFRSRDSHKFRRRWTGHCRTSGRGQVNTARSDDEHQL
jgi:integrase/recombinase XerD